MLLVKTDAGAISSKLSYNFRFMTFIISIENQHQHLLLNLKQRLILFFFLVMCSELHTGHIPRRAAERSSLQVGIQGPASPAFYPHNYLFSASLSIFK